MVKLSLWFYLWGLVLILIFIVYLSKLSILFVLYLMSVLGLEARIWTWDLLNMKQESMYLPTMFIKFCIAHCINHELITIFIYRSNEFIAVFIYRSHFVLHIFILKNQKCTQAQACPFYLPHWKPFLVKVRFIVYVRGYQCFREWVSLFRNLLKSCLNLMSLWQQHRWKLNLLDWCGPTSTIFV
jgi:hypothetical protein